MKDLSYIERIECASLSFIAALRAEILTWTGTLKKKKGMPNACNKESRESFYSPGFYGSVPRDMDGSE